LAVEQSLKFLLKVVNKIAASAAQFVKCICIILIMYLCTGS